MSLAASLSAAKNKPHGLPCPLAVILRGLDAADSKALEDALARDTYDPEYLTNGAIQGALAEWNHKVHIKGIEKHRRHICRCYVGTPK